MTMKKISTKETAEAILRDLPSVLGASVREDVAGHPREVHLLISAGPNPKHLARDVRELLEERLGVPIDQRVISIAQLSDRPDTLPSAAPSSAAPSSAAPSSTATEAPAVEAPAMAAPARPAFPVELAQALAPRLVYQGIESLVRDGRIQVRVRLSRRDQEFVGEGVEVDGGLGRVRAAATATLRAATEACEDRVRLEVETISLTQALGREYVLVAALAASQLIGRRPLSLVGAQPVESSAEIAAALAALQATNRILGIGLP